MQHIEMYYKKINKMLESRRNASGQKGKGLLSPGKNVSIPKDKDQIQVIADIVDGIRDARKEMKNAR